MAELEGDTRMLTWICDSISIDNATPYLITIKRANGNVCLCYRFHESVTEGQHVISIAPIQ